jgi:prepilin-type N-terminal cleavage/methylation domain-containing protein
MRVLNRIRQREGFTLTEMLATMAVLAIVFATFSLVISSTLRHNAEVEESTVQQTEARAALERFATDLRQTYTGDDVNFPSTFPIETIGNTTITFFSPDRKQPFHLRKLTYRLNAGGFERAFLTSTDTDGWPWAGLTAAPSAWQRLVGSVRNSTIFTYYNAAGAQLAATAANRTLVRTVRLTLVTSTPTSQSRQTTYETSVTVRADV